MLLEEMNENITNVYKLLNIKMNKSVHEFNSFKLDTYNNILKDSNEFVSSLTFVLLDIIPDKLIPEGSHKLYYALASALTFDLCRGYKDREKSLSEFRIKIKDYYEGLTNDLETNEYNDEYTQWCLDLFVKYLENK